VHHVGSFVWLIYLTRVQQTSTCSVTTPFSSFHSGLKICLARYSLVGRSSHMFMPFLYWCVYFCILFVSNCSYNFLILCLQSYS